MAQGLVCEAGLPAGAGEAPETALSWLERLKREAVDFSIREGWTVCHAAAAKVDGRLVVFPGAAGSGKSTLAVVLALRGYAVADELVLLRGSGDGVEALAPPLPLSVEERVFRRLPRAAPWRFGPRELPSGKVLLKPPASLAGLEKVAAVVFLRRDGARSGRSLRRASRREAARVLLENIVRQCNGGPRYVAPRRRAWETFCALLDRTPSYVLRGDFLSEGDAVADLVEGVLEGGRYV